MSIRRQSSRSCLLLFSGDSTTLDASNTADLKGFPQTWIFANACTLNPPEDEKTKKKVLKTQELHLHTGPFDVLSNNVSIATNQGTFLEGAPGHSLTFSSTNFSTANHFEVDSSGSRGSSATAGQQKAQKGGDGGPGGSVTLLLNSRFDAVASSASDVTDPKKKKDKAKNFKSWIDLVLKTKNLPKALQDSVQAVAKDLKEKKELSDADMDDFLNNAVMELQACDVDFRNAFKVNSAGGDYGVGTGGADGPNGSPGAPGQVSRGMLISYTMRNSTEPLVHPDQVAMTLRDAQVDYLIGTNDSLGRVQLALSDLVERLEWLTDLKDTDPICKAYKLRERQMFIISSDSGTPASITSLRESRATAISMQRRVKQGYDYFGNENIWVPRVSLTDYRKHLADVIAATHEVEATYFRFEADEKTRLSKQEQLDAAKDAADREQHEARKDIEDLRQDMEATIGRINVHMGSLPYLRDAVQTAIKDIPAKVKNSFDVSIEDICSAAGQIAFAPGLPMAAIQGLSLFNTADTTVLDDEGHKIQKEFLISKLTALTDGLANIKDHITPGTGGTIDISDPGAVSLLATRDEFVKTMEKYHTVFDLNDLRMVKSAFEAYIKAITTRNNEVLHYNLAIAALIDARQKAIASGLHLERLSRQSSSTIEPDNPGLLLMVQRAYFSMATAALSALYTTAKAMRFYTLSDPPLDFTTLRQPGFPRRGLAALLASESITLENALISVRENWSSGADAFGHHLPGEVTSPLDPIVYPIPLEYIQTLRDEDTATPLAPFTVSVPIPAVRATTAKKNHPFAGHADVRITGVRLYLDGVKTADNKLSVHIEHMGDEEIVSTKDRVLHFRHRSIQAGFTYDLGTRKSTTGDNNFASDVGMGKDGFALPGPFTSWRVVVRKDWNDGLEMGGLSGGRFEFSGWRREFGI
ncbi:hypothetical protein B0T16DRAFT_505757 [Cercophora newfieldiana]|uniref:Uncharacterized protein n=1 Tax=Cercophora newfieldiana TaxID=92897 RepID=A0AA40CXM3_9PEZI|nr:hypothetical protein B0T16DRAFT_505757 [Cercophora newfieldiana]